MQGGRNRDGHDKDGMMLMVIIDEMVMKRDANWNEGDALKWRGYLCDEGFFLDILDLTCFVCNHWTKLIRIQIKVKVFADLLLLGEV